MDHKSRRTHDELLGSTLAFGVFASEDADPCAFDNPTLDEDDEDNFDALGRDAVYGDKPASMRGRLSATVQAIAANSHRTFVYAFVLMPTLARLVRFDHSGIVYSELFPWRTSSDLVDFLVRFDCMSAAQRGCDTSVTPIPSDSEDVLRAREILARCDTLPKSVTKSTIIPPNYKGCLSRVHVYDDETESFHRVIVHHAISSADCFIGRATRGFYGVDLDEELVVYVKDAWRVDSSSLTPEATTCRRLVQKKVPHLADYYFGGDVPEDTPALLLPSSEKAHEIASQTTSAWCEVVDEHPEYSEEESGVGARSRSYIHHRLLFKKIGLPLKTFESTRQLCIALLDAMEGASVLFHPLTDTNTFLCSARCGVRRCPSPPSRYQRGQHNHR